MLDILGALNWKWTALSWDIDRDLQSQIDFFEQQWNTTVADAFRWIQNERTWVFSGFQDNLLNYYDQFEKVQNPAFQQFVKASNDQAGRVLPEIEQQAKFVREKFWPTGEIAGKANAYFQDLIKTVNQNVSWEVATASNMSQRQWGSRAWLNAAIQDARAKWLPLISQIKSQELAEKERLYSNYLALVDWLRQQRINIEDTNIKAPLLELQKQLNLLGSNIVTSMRDVDAMNIWEIQAGIANDRALWNMYAENQLKLDNIANEALVRSQVALPVDPSTLIITSNPDRTTSAVDSQWNKYQQRADGNWYKVATNNMTTDFIKSKEWFREDAYQDSAWVWTIWYWTTRINWKPVTQWMKISRDEADNLFQQQLQSYQNWKNYIDPATLSEWQKTALTSFEYNLGSWIWEKNAMPILDRIKSWDISWAQNIMKKYIYAWGKPLQWLANRRNEESNLLNT